ncbi:MAG: multiubiquitin domain-containing protein [Gammaproteobacteria bacterium]|nr:multiubiquitin domain-containing protein [Gammaproteobacteria bacterium]MCY4218056.1 multiubiquitin domain-containing protein [Gammaproteobacteria bacterium]MCY4275924.1 multiubiquitin domain-containing protein [Gammaproteobacteria bacterium]
MKIKILIDGKSYKHTGSLIRAEELYKLVSCQGKQLFIDRPDDIDIPLDPMDVLVLYDEKSFITGKTSIESNPLLRNEIQFRFNGEITPSVTHAKITGRDLKKFDDEHPKGRLFVDISTGPDAEVTDDMIVVVQNDDSFFVIPAGDETNPEDPVDIEDCGRHGRRPPKGVRYRVRIDREKYTVKQDQITGAQILEYVDKSPDEWTLNQKMRGGERKRINPDDIVNVSQPGIERFETVLRQAQQGCG